MNIIRLIITLSLFATMIYGQELDTLSQSDHKVHIDNNFGYKVMIPDWLTIKETGNPNQWGGTLAPIDGCENAILIIGFTKEDYKNVKKLKYDKIEKYKSGDKINSNQTLMLRKELGPIENIGDGYKVQLLTGNTLYDNMFVFAETIKGYLLIMFTAIPDTYEINIEKFHSFLGGLVIINKE